MEKEKKICPILTLAHDDMPHWCEEERCEWWTVLYTSEDWDEVWGCSIKLMAIKNASGFIESM
jgi:hypothetical protein